MKYIYILILLVCLWIFIEYNKKNIDNFITNVKEKFGESKCDNALYSSETSYDKLVDVFDTKKDNYHNCQEADKYKQEDYVKELVGTLELVSVPLVVFNRSSRPVMRTFCKTIADMPGGKSLVEMSGNKFIPKLSKSTDKKVCDKSLTEILGYPERVLSGNKNNRSKEVLLIASGSC